MRKLRTRIIVLMMVIVGISCTISIFVTVLHMNGFFEARTIERMVWGMAVRDVILILLVLICIGLWVYMLTHRATNPIAEVSKVMRSVANGNYNVVLDIDESSSDFIQLEKDVNTMLTQLKNNEYLHKDFSSNISHEFKTPLAIIKGYADLLQTAELSDEDRINYSAQIARESSRLTSLTANLLKLSSLDYNETHLKRTTFSVSEQIRQTVVNMEPRWTGKNLRIDLELKDAEFNGEEELLNQVWMNLLDNAIKFTPEGGKISINVLKTKEEIHVTVEDNGIGMNEETVTHVFEQFYRGDTENRYEGSGLGLSLVQRIVQLHGGTVLVESVRGSGSIFMITLPL